MVHTLYFCDDVGEFWYFKQINLFLKRESNFSAWKEWINKTYNKEVCRASKPFHLINFG